MAANATLDLSITGMTCGSCVRHVTRALQDLDGVAEARVSLADGSARVAYDPEAATEAQVIESVEEAGYQAAALTARAKGLPVRGDCGCTCCS